MQILKYIFGRVMLGGLCFLLLACLIPFLPVSLWLFDLAAHFQSYYFTFSLCLFSVAVLLFSRKGWRQSRLLKQILGISLLCLLLSGISLAPYLTRPQKSPETDSAPMLRLIQVNVFKFNRQHDKLLHYIDKHNPDLITIAEATPEWRDALEPLTTKTDGWPHVIDLAKNGSNGMMVLSRHAFTQQEVLYPATETHPAVLFGIRFGGKEVLIASLHPLSPVTRKRFAQRDTYLNGVAARIAHAQEEAVIVAGDFNTTMYAPSYKKFLRRTKLRDSRTGRGFYPTWPVYVPLPIRFKADNLHIPHLLRIPIDHVLYKGNLQLIKFETLPSIDSDHLAGFAVFQ